jgi:hypothetical protein
MIVGQVILRDEKGKSILDAEGAITSRNVGDFRISPEQVDAAAAKLEDLGFVIERKDDLGLSVSGPEELFRRVFHIAPSTTPPTKARVPDELAAYIADVVIPEAPEFFP